MEKRVTGRYAGMHAWTKNTPINWTNKLWNMWKSFLVTPLWWATRIVRSHSYFRKSNFLTKQYSKHIFTIIPVIVVKYNKTKLLAFIVASVFVFFHLFYIYLIHLSLLYVLVFPLPMLFHSNTHWTDTYINRCLDIIHIVYLNETQANWEITSW